MKHLLRFAGLAAVCLLSGLALAQLPAPLSEFAEGEVRRIQKETNRITLRHGEIKSLDMPPMSMVFQAKDPALLDQVKVGDKVRFVAEKSGGTYFVTRIEAAK